MASCCGSRTRSCATSPPNTAQAASSPPTRARGRAPPEKRDHAAIEAGKVKTIAAMKILDAQLAKTAFVVGDTLSMGDIPVALMAYRFRRLVPERPPLDHLERWFAAIEQRPAFKEHVLAIPFV
jgi:glutathione S-transferase